jgi:hypothetical protein
MPDSRYRIQDTGYRIQDTGYRIQDTGYRIQDTGYRIQDARCRAPLRECPRTCPDPSGMQDTECKMQVEAMRRFRELGWVK